MYTLVVFSRVYHIHGVSLFFPPLPRLNIYRQDSGPPLTRYHHPLTLEWIQIEPASPNQLPFLHVPGWLTEHLLSSPLRRTCLCFMLALLDSSRSLQGAHILSSIDSVIVLSNVSLFPFPSWPPQPPIRGVRFHVLYNVFWMNSPVDLLLRRSGLGE